MGKKWKRAEKQLVRERKYIVRFLKQHHVKITYPPRWNAIHVTMNHSPIRNMNDIKTVALLYGNRNDRSVDHEPMSMVPVIDTNDAKDIIEISKRWNNYMNNVNTKGIPEWIKEQLECNNG